MFKVGKDLIDGDEYVKRVQRDIFLQSVKNNSLINYYRTYNFAKAQAKLAEQAKLKWEQDIYKKIIERCSDDIDKAIKAMKPYEEVEKLTEIMETFIRKFGYLE